jgi:hypothetical protein
MAINSAGMTPMELAKKLYIENPKYASVISAFPEA